MLILNGSSEGEIIDATRPIIAGAAEVADAHLIAPHHHPRGQLLYAESGVMQVSVGLATWRVASHCGVWVPSDIPHQVAATAGVSYRSLYVAPALSHALPRCGTALAIEPLTRELICEAATFGAAYQLGSAEARLLAVLQDRLNKLSSAKISLRLPRDARAKRVCQALLDQPADDRSLAAWGRLVGASNRTLARLFLCETGMTFGAWVQSMRLTLALEMLAQGASVTRVALDLGYATPSAFSAMFRRRLGASPSRYLA